MADFWAVARTEPQREKVAQHFLRLAHFETYLPLIISLQTTNGRKVDIRRPLFPSYIFIWIVDHQWWSARWCPGVATMIMGGADGGPAHLHDDVIREIRAREPPTGSGVVRLPKPPRLRLRQPVRILSGSFVGRIGLYDGMASHQRERVLLDLLGQKVPITLPSADVVPHGAS
jgi:transcriptional antiterminator RfaH